MAIFSVKSQQIIGTSPIVAVHAQSILLMCGLEIFLSNDEINAVNELTERLEIKQIEHENNGGC